MELLRPDAAGIARAVELLGEGAVVAFPTDTVYGLGATDAGVSRIYELKGREPDKPLVLMAADSAALAARVTLPPGAERLMRRFWPGPLTLVLPATRGGTLGLRVPAHPPALDLLRASGPIWTTSANRSGQAEALTAAEAAAALPGVDAVLDGGRAPGGRPSTVLDLTGARPVILRAGAIPDSELSL